MIVRVRIDFTEEERQAFRYMLTSKTGKATREELRSHTVTCIKSDLDDLVSQFRKARGEE